ncbi:MAG: hypothetical protein IJY20_03895 [Clostridia bacterium]|nr:hypothetical protein [Clostridia bacterium]
MLFFTCLPLCGLIMMASMLLAQAGFRARQPIFGNRQHVSKPFVHELIVYPLCSRAFWQSLSVESRKKAKRITIVLLSLFLVFAALVPFGIHPRETIDSSYAFSTYNAFDQRTHHASIEEAQTLLIDTQKTNRSVRRYILLSVVFVDKTYTVSLSSFGKEERADSLRVMLTWKAMLDDGRCQVIAKREDVDWMLMHEHYTQEEIDLIYDLLDYERR